MLDSASLRLAFFMEREIKLIILLPLPSKLNINRIHRNHGKRLSILILLPIPNSILAHLMHWPFRHKTLPKNITAHLTLLVEISHLNWPFLLSGRSWSLLSLAKDLHTGFFR